MLKQSLFLIATSLATGQLLGCSSPQRSGIVSDKPVAQDTSEYILRARYPEKPPTWALDFESFDRANSGHGVSYYLGESGDVNDRIAGCDLAALEANRKIAELIARYLTSQIGGARTGVLISNKDSAQDDALGSHFQEVVASESLALLTGVREYGHYWEERDYSPSGGRRRVYTCEVVVTIDDQHLREAVRRAGGDVARQVSDPDARELVRSAFRRMGDATQLAGHASAPATRETSSPRKAETSSEE